jgi:hypothetical protein
LLDPVDRIRAPWQGAPVLFLEAAVMRRGAAIVVLLALAALGCTESNQNRIIVRVTAINGGGPLFADVLAYDDMDSLYYIPTDLTPVELTNRPYSGSIVDPGNFSLDFHVQAYTVTWRATQGTPAGLNLAQYTHTEATSFVVPFNATAELAASVVAVGMKSTAPFAALALTGGEIPLIADIAIVGAPAVEPDDQMQIQASLSVVFADFADVDR